MKLDVKDSELVVRPRHKYYWGRWAIVIGIPVYIALIITAGVLVGPDLVIPMIFVPFILGLVIVVSIAFWNDFGDDIKDWLFEKKET